jgi:hypothetical protein
VTTALTWDSPADERDLEIMRAQLGRPMRGVLSVARRCACGRPAVVRTLPRLPGGTPFPTLFYLTLPSAARAISTLESTGVMARWTDELGDDEELAAGHRRAHDDYLARRLELGDPEEIRGISAGGMPTRVKCLHVLAAHALAVGPGVTPLGDRTLAVLADEWTIDRCDCDAEIAAPSPEEHP